MDKPSDGWQAQVSSLLHSDPQAGLLRRRFREDLRSARAKVTADAEGFEVVVHAIERLGRHLRPSGHGLGYYEEPLISLVMASGESTAGLAEQLFLLRQTRNDHAHQGHAARNAARDAVRVAIRLEDALSKDSKKDWPDITLEHIMVTDVVTTRPGDTLNDVRRMLQEHAFTAVPARVKEVWYLITDRWLASQLAGKKGPERNAVLKKKVEDALAAKGGPEKAPVHSKGKSLGDSDVVADVLSHALILVASGPAAEWLEGVVAPSDLL